MSKSFRKDLTGQRFGRLTVIEFVPNDKRKTFWKCQCDCGKVCVVARDILISGDSKSCGCLHREQLKKMNLHIHTKHGDSHSRLYYIWKSMKQRCYYPKHKHYKDYGGRGITICEEWLRDFSAFRDWAVANGYDDALSIERIDVNGNYSPVNCKWVDMKMQGRNKRNNVFVEYKGEKITLVEVAERIGLNYRTLFDRYLKGDRGEKLLRPVKSK